MIQEPIIPSFLAIGGVFTLVLAKHAKSFNLIDTLAVGVDRIQRSFEPMQRQVELWRQTQLGDDREKLILYRAFVEGEDRSLASRPMPTVDAFADSPPAELPQFLARTKMGSLPSVPIFTILVVPSVFVFACPDFPDSAYADHNLQSSCARLLFSERLVVEQCKFTRRLGAGSA